MMPACQTVAAKRQLLEKVCACLEAATGQPSELNPRQLLLAREPEKTNRFLQLLVSVAVKDQVA